MYHYVREFDSNYPNFRFLNIKNFRKQLDYFETEFGFVSKKEFQNIVDGGKLESSNNKVMLTFDDGLSCHYNFVYQELLRRGLWAIFFIPVAPYLTRNILDVHLIHLLCGKINGGELMGALEAELKPGMCSSEYVNFFESKVYGDQKNDASTTKFKKFLNYYLDHNYRTEILKRLSEKFCVSESVENFYMTIDQLKIIKSSGNIIGSHGLSHKVMSTLDEFKQANELDIANAFLADNNLTDDNLYSYPYGGRHSYNSTTTKLLSQRSVKLAFDVNPIDFRGAINCDAKYSVPRFDCNLFPFGEAE